MQSKKLWLKNGRRWGYIEPKPCQENNAGKGEEAMLSKIHHPFFGIQRANRSLPPPEIINFIQNFVAL